MVPRNRGVRITISHFTTITNKWPPFHFPSELDTTSTSDGQIVLSVFEFKDDEDALRALKVISKSLYDLKSSDVKHGPAIDVIKNSVDSFTRYYAGHASNNVELKNEVAFVKAMFLTLQSEHDALNAMFLAYRVKTDASLQRLQEDQQRLQKDKIRRDSLLYIADSIILLRYYHLNALVGGWSFFTNKLGQLKAEVDLGTKAAEDIEHFLAPYEANMPQGVQLRQVVNKLATMKCFIANLDNRATLPDATLQLADHLYNIERQLKLKIF